MNILWLDQYLFIIHFQFKQMIKSKSNRSQLGFKASSKSRTIQSRVSINSQTKTIIQEVETPDQTLYVQEWYESMIKKIKCLNIQQQASPIGFIVKIQQINSVQFKKKEGTSKILIKIVANLYNKTQKFFYGKTYQSSAVQMHETKNRKDQFQLSQPSSIYFYSYQSKKDLIDIKIQFQICQINKVSTVINKKTIGAISINPFSLNNKNKQRQILKSHILDQGKPSSVMVAYTVVNTQALKVLYKLIPPNCLCGVQDYIPGLFNGGHLLNVTNYLKLQYTSLNNLKFQLFSIQTAQSLNFQIIKITQNYFNSRVKDEIKQVMIKNVYLKMHLHNGWKTVNQSQIQLIEKKSLQIKNKTGMYKLLIYQSKHLLTLPFVFTQSQTVINLQLIYHIQAKTDQQIQDLNIAIASLNIPMINPKQITKKKSIMKSGPHLSITNQLPVISNSIPIKIQYQMHIGIKDQMQNIMEQNRNFEQYDRIQMQKSRMIQQKKKVKMQRRKIQLQLTNPQIPNTLDIIQETFTEKITNVRRQKDQMQFIVQQLRAKLKNYEIQEQQQQIEKKNQNQQGEEIQFKQAIFYEAYLQNPKNNKKDIIAALPYVLQTEQINEQIIKTQLNQYIYCNCIMLDFISMFSDSHKIPRKFSVQVNFFNYPTLKTKQLTVNINTGQIQHVQQQNLTQKHPLYHIQIQPHTICPRQYYLNLLTYLQTTKMQIIIIDQDSKIQFGYALIALKDLIRRRRQQVRILFESQIFIKDTIKGIIKIQVSNIRQQPKPVKTIQQKVLIRNITQKGEKLKVVSQNILKIDNNRKISPIKMQLVGQQRQKLRIKNFKQKNSEGFSKPQNIQQYKQLKKLNLIQKIIQQNVISQKTLAVIYLIPQFVFFQFRNDFETRQTFKLAIIDSDEKYIRQIQQLKLIKQKSDVLNFMQEKFIDNIQNSSIKNINSDCTFDLEKNQKITLVFKYQSSRRFLLNQNKNQTYQKYSNFNHDHTISISISKQQQLIGIFILKIKPQPDITTFFLKYYKQQNSNVSIDLPPFLPKTHVKNYKISFNNPQLLSQWRNDFTQIRISCVTPKLQDFQRPIDFDMLIFEDQYQTYQICKWNIKIFSCQKIVINCQLGITNQVRITVDKNIKGQFLAAFSQDQKVMQVSQVSKSSNNSYYFKLKVTPNFIYSKQLLINLMNLRTKQIVKRYIIQINSQQPYYKHSFKISHKRSIQKRLQDFQYINPLPKKALFQISTTNPYLLKPQQSKLEMMASKARQFKIVIMAPLSNIQYAQVTFAFVDKQQQIREFILFKITYQ